MRTILVLKGYTTFGFRLTEEDIAEGFIVKFESTDIKSAFNTLTVTRNTPTENETTSNAHSVSSSTLPKRRIPGHPECYHGDCANCHNVACSIHQGFVEEPTYEQCEEIDVASADNSNINL